MEPDEVRRHVAFVLYRVAATEDYAARVFDGLAAHGRPEHRTRREELARQARHGAESATALADQIVIDFRSS